ncbi:MAG: hypothetical protein WC089_03825 [Candidatus Paceibacterota bacterium]
MKLVNKFEIRLENFEKCHLITDQDCPIGQLYDYACALKAFISKKIKETEEAAAAAEVKVEDSAKV